MSSKSSPGVRIVADRRRSANANPERFLDRKQVLAAERILPDNDSGDPAPNSDSSHWSCLASKDPCHDGHTEVSGSGPPGRRVLE